MIGTVIENRYRIVRELGVGGMAEVYLAHDDEADRDVAIKMIKHDYCEDPQYVRRFEREAKAVMTLDCPNIVHAYSCGTLEGRSYMVLEYVDGLSLKEYLQRSGKLSQRTSVQIACHILNALAAAHSGGYVHRDVKPQNVLISKDRTIKLTDFGIAKDAASKTVTFNGKSVVGSVQYISPEQVSGDTVTSASDLYSVGVMLYEMLLGRPPFDGETSVQIAYKHVNERLIPPCEADEGISPALSDVIVKATAKDPMVRYSSAEQMKADLIRALKEPEERFAYLDPKLVMQKPHKDGGEDGAVDEDASRGQKKHYAKLWHFILPASLMVALVIGMFVYWYFAMFGASPSGIVKVPDVLGHTVEEAAVLLKNRDFEIKEMGTKPDPEYADGSICSQSPEAGSALEKGSTVQVWVSSGGQVLTMQSLIGMTLEEASASLRELDLTIDSIEYSYDPNDQMDAREGTIVWQSIPEGTDIVPGGESVSIKIYGYQGVTLVPMPDLRQASSIERLDRMLDVYGVTSRRFVFAEITKGGTQDGDGPVLSQTPSAGLPFLPSDTTVEITLYRDYNLAQADIAFELVVDRDDTDVEVTLMGEYGEFVLYRANHEKAEHADIAFTAGYIESGVYTLIVYTNGTEAMRFDAEFTGR